jgi:hypothetical protein
MNTVHLERDLVRIKKDTAKQIQFVEAAIAAFKTYPEWDAAPELSENYERLLLGDHWQNFVGLDKFNGELLVYGELETRLGVACRTLDKLPAVIKEWNTLAVRYAEQNKMEADTREAVAPLRTFREQVDTVRDEIERISTELGVLPVVTVDHSSCTSAASWKREDQMVVANFSLKNGDVYIGGILITADPVIYIRNLLKEKQ